MAERIPQSVAYLVVFRAYLASDGKTPATGKTIAVTISKNGATSFSNIAAGATNATELASGFYKFTLATGDTDTVGPLAWRGAQADINDAGDVLTVAKATNAGFSSLPDAAAEASGGIFTRGTGAGQINQPANGMADVNVVRNAGTAITAASGIQEVKVASIANNAIAAAAIASDAITAAKIADGAIDAATFAAGAINAAAIAADAITDAKVASDVTIASVTGAVGSVTGAVGSVTGDVSGKVLGGGAGTISGTGVRAVDGSGNAIAPASATTQIQADTDDIQTRLPAALTAGGNMKAGVQGFLDTVFTEGATGRIAAAFKQFFNIATPAATMDHGVLIDTATTATNLTNAPTAGDFTATMKTSLNAATPAVTVSDKTGFSLSVAGVQAIWDALTSALTAPGSIGKWIIDKLDVVLSTRLASSSYTAPDNSGISAIKTQTDKLTFTVANQVDSNVLDWKSSTAPAMTGDAFARIGAAGEGLTALGDTRIAHLDADVSTRLADADYTEPPTAADNADAVWEEAIADHSGTAGSTAEVLENAGAAGTPPTVGEIADAVWEEQVADHSGTSGSTAASLNAAGGAGDPWATTLPGAYGAGTAGKIIGDNINATVSSRATQTSVDDVPTNAELATALGTADDAVLAAVAALNNLSQANIRTAVGLGSANLDTQLSTLAAYIDTEVAAIKAKTDNLPSDPADASDIAASFSSIASTLSTIAGYINMEVAAIKLKTDKLTFDADNALDANVQKVNDVTLTGNGTSGTPWGPV